MEILSSKLTIVIFLLLAAAAATAGLTTKELDAALLALQSRGYTLFPNAITTSDLQARLLSSQNSSIFTLFAPPDSLLFSLDLLSSARLYTFSLFLHVAPHFLSSADLLVLPRPTFIDTLFPNRRLFVEHTMSTRNGTALLTVTVDGVVVSVPDLFIGSNLAVHGLDGILVARYGSLVSEGSDTNTDTAIAEPPKFSYQTSPANSPEILSPMGSGDLEMVTIGTKVDHIPNFIIDVHDNPMTYYTSIAEPPKFYHQSYVSPANSPESLPPMGSGAPEMVTVGTRIKKDKGAFHGIHDRGTTMRTKHGYSNEFWFVSEFSYCKFELYVMWQRNHCNYSRDTALIAEPPKFSHQTYVFTGRPTGDLPPTGIGAPEIVKIGARTRNDKGDSRGNKIEALR
ncbi:putative Citrate-binding protein precursor [Hibiscus syriacus]|uniref:Citrate-binding protein n=1 Tax=Hibiscus syriacus TaxID=106335 RepID=A0A6A2ZJW2_HIBSY|nr:putative Citrate-binding protein precursor [Hibiscus syriacus]